MSNEICLASVVIPTHNRRDSLRRVLDSLAGQSVSANRFEVIVVLDGCQDDSKEMVSDYSAAYVLKILELEGNGAGVARNKGAEIANGNILIFLDDDIEAGENLVAAHLDAHGSAKDTVVIGYLPPVMGLPMGYFHMEARGWWEDKFTTMRNPGHRYHFTDVLSGNFSLRREYFKTLHGFNQSFSGGIIREDYELGYRLILKGATLKHVPAAMGFHHDITDLKRTFRRARDEGKSDIKFLDMHPELLPQFRLSNIFGKQPFRGRVLRKLLFFFRPAADLIARIYEIRLNLLERRRRRKQWRKLHFTLRQFWYWRGVVDVLVSREAVADYMENCRQACISPAEIDNKETFRSAVIDLRKGILHCENEVNDLRPDCLEIYYGNQFLSSIPALPGAEALRGVHLRQALREELGWSVLLASAVEKTFDANDLPDLFSVSRTANEQTTLS